MMDSHSQYLYSQLFYYNSQAVLSVCSDTVLGQESTITYRLERVKLIKCPLTGKTTRLRNNIMTLKLFMFSTVVYKISVAK